MLAEKGGRTLEEVVPAPGFRLAATMNPGGDYGKRELSPALVNRFTCLWVPPLSHVEELSAIVTARLAGELLPTSWNSVNTCQWQALPTEELS